MSPLHKITALLLSHFSCRIPLNVLLHITVFSYTEMPTLPFPPGGSRFYARNTASRIGCKSPVFHTTLFQNQNGAHIYLFNERKPPMQVAHEVSQEFRLFTNIKIWRTVRLKKALSNIYISFIYTCRQGMGHMVFTDCLGRQGERSQETHVVIVTDWWYMTCIMYRTLTSLFDVFVYNYAAMVTLHRLGLNAIYTMQYVVHWCHFMLRWSILSHLSVNMQSHPIYIPHSPIN